MADELLSNRPTEVFVAMLRWQNAEYRLHRTIEAECGKNNTPSNIHSWGCIDETPAMEAMQEYLETKRRFVAVKTDRGRAKRPQIIDNFLSIAAMGYNLCSRCGGSGFDTQWSLCEQCQGRGSEESR